MKTNLDEILNQTFFGFDALTMLGDVEHFVEFSESNIARQKDRELRRAERECDEEEFDDPGMETQYRNQMIEGVVYRFEVSLTQRVRYAALTAFITTIEWFLRSLKNNVSFPFPSTPDKKNEAVHTLTVFNERAVLGLESKIRLLEVLIQVRNCVVHAAGLLDSYRHTEQLLQRLPELKGIKVSSINYLGKSIEIESGFLERIVADTKSWLPSLQRDVSKMGLLNK